MNHPVFITHEGRMLVDKSPKTPTPVQPETQEVLSISEIAEREAAMQSTPRKQS
jgi:hypothetical protein